MIERKEKQIVGQSEVSEEKKKYACSASETRDDVSASTGGDGDRVPYHHNFMSVKVISIENPCSKCSTSYHIFTFYRVGGRLNIYSFLLKR